MLMLGSYRFHVYTLVGHVITVVCQFLEVSTIFLPAKRKLVPVQSWEPYYYISFKRKNVRNYTKLGDKRHSFSIGLLLRVIHSERICQKKRQIESRSQNNNHIKKKINQKLNNTIREFDDTYPSAIIL